MQTGPCPAKDLHFKRGCVQFFKGVWCPFLCWPRNFFCARELPFEGMCQVQGFFGGRRPYFMHFPHFQGFMREIQERGSGHTKFWMERDGSPRPRSSVHAQALRTHPRGWVQREVHRGAASALLAAVSVLGNSREPENDETWCGIFSRPLKDVVKIRGRFGYSFTKA